MFKSAIITLTTIAILTMNAQAGESKLPGDQIPAYCKVWMGNAKIFPACDICKIRPDKCDKNNGGTITHGGK